MLRTDSRGKENAWAVDRVGCRKEDSCAGKGNAWAADRVSCGKEDFCAANGAGGTKGRVLMLASVASMIDQFNLPNIRLLLHMKYEVHVACNFIEGNTCDEKRLQDLKKKLNAMHVHWHQWDCPRSASSFLKCRRAYRQLCGLLEKQGFSWMHCHSPVGGALARLAGHRYGVRVVYTAHGFHFYRGAPFRNWLLFYPVEKLLAYWTDVLITVNREDYRFARRRLGAGKIFYIPGVGVDLAEFAGTGLRDAHFCEVFDIPQDSVVLLSTGELIPRKNHRTVLDALAVLHRTDVYYLICGQGPLYGELQQYADKCGCGANVRLAGYRERMDWILRNADIFVFPSLQEGLPVALLEAMAAGLPCVVSDIRGNRELVRAEERFAPDSPGELAGLLERLLADSGYRQACGAYNRRHVQKYDRRRVQERMKKIYGTLEMETRLGKDE